MRSYSRPYDPPRDCAERTLLLATAVMAMVLPFVVGAWVKLELDALGKPTLTWLGGATAVAILALPVSFGWGLYAAAMRWAWGRPWRDARVRPALAWGWAAGLAGGAITLSILLYGMLQVAAYALELAVLMPWAYWWRTLEGCAAGLLVGFGPGWVYATVRDDWIARHAAR